MHKWQKSFVNVLVVSKLFTNFAAGNGTAKVNAQIKAIEVKSPNVSIDLW